MAGKRLTTPKSATLAPAGRRLPVSLILACKMRTVRKAILRDAARVDQASADGEGTDRRERRSAGNQ